MACVGIFITQIRNNTSDCLPFISQIIFKCYLFKIYGSKGKNESNNFPPLSKASAHATGKTSLLLRSIIVSQKANWWLLKIKKYIENNTWQNQYNMLYQPE
jgi:hypothetical protein